MPGTPAEEPTPNLLPSQRQSQNQKERPIFVSVVTSFQTSTVGSDVIKF